MGGENCMGMRSKLEEGQESFSRESAIRLVCLDRKDVSEMG